MPTVVRDAAFSFLRVVLRFHWTMHSAVHYERQQVRLLFPHTCHHIARQVVTAADEHIVWERPAPPYCVR